MGDSIVPRRCALRFKPPTLILLYSDCISGKQRRRSMPLRGIGKNTNIEAFSSNLLNHPRHSLYFKAIPIQQLYSLLRRVKDACHKNEKVKEEAYTHPTTQHSLRQLNTCSTTASCEKEHRKLHGQVSECYDIPFKIDTQTSPSPELTTKEFSLRNKETKHPLPPVTVALGTAALQELPPLPNTQYVGDSGKVASLSLDDLLGPVIEEQDLIKQTTVSDDTGDTRAVSLCHVSVKQTVMVSTEPPEYSNDFSSNDDMANGIDRKDESLSFKGVEVNSSGSDGDGVESESYGHNHQLRNLSLAIPEIVTGDSSEASGNKEQDLNKVSEHDLDLTKEKMDYMFQMNRVQPGEEGWLYDKQNKFGPPCMESGWDSDSSSTQEF